MMKIRASLVVCALAISAIASAQYSEDILGADFQQRTFVMPDDYDGKVVSTLVRRVPLLSTQRALLYIHGYNDYFFQSEMAAQFAADNYNFYAIDLRKYGRSLLPEQIPFQVLDLSEYFADIDSALQVVQQEGNSEIILMGHSTGGLIASLYCQAHEANLPFQGLILNSPFLDMNLGWAMENLALPVVSLFGALFPDAEMSQSSSTAYSESLSREHHGEWEMDSTLKMPISPPYTAGWLRAIHQGHQLVQRQGSIPCPILLLYSDKSLIGEEWTPEFQRADAVLDVADIAKYGKLLGDNVTEVEIPDGMHDLVLSAPEVRESVYHTIFDWLDSLKQ